MLNDGWDRNEYIDRQNGEKELPLEFSPIMDTIDPSSRDSKSSLELIRETDTKLKSLGVRNMYMEKWESSEDNYSALLDIGFDVALAESMFEVASATNSLEKNPRLLTTKDIEVLSLVKAFVLLNLSKANKYIKVGIKDGIISTAMFGGIEGRIGKLIIMDNLSPTFFSAESVKHPLIFGRNILLRLSELNRNNIDPVLLTYQTEEVLSWLGQSELLNVEGISPNGLSNEDILNLFEDGEFSIDLFIATISTAMLRVMSERKDLIEEVSSKNIYKVLQIYLFYSKYKANQISFIRKNKRAEILNKLVDDVGKRLNIDTRDAHNHFGIGGENIFNYF